ncbi:hypothetical protein [Candidatus Magnetaquicoccus inordinatus]|uniref:hypothetical protein n=1 Tax=Candidatus Magnetaquicoccus inordinatus TaxID=2496818 RepID=UPI00102BA8DE|nr:hypothetical protein [Candidatus Magnetaquicoccus inordinatus]
MDSAAETPSAGETEEAVTLNLQPLFDPSLPTRLPTILATHHPKLGHSKVDNSQSVLCMQTAARDRKLKIGICSRTLESRYGFGALPGGAEIALSMALACDLGWEDPMSVVALLAAGQAAPPGMDAATWSGLQAAFAQLSDRAPATVSQYERLVFFEGIDEEILLTPLPSLKWVQELNRRLRERDERFKKAEPHAAQRRIARNMLPVGGANPQNVGYVVNKMTRNTRRGAIPVLSVTPPVDRRSTLQRLLARIGYFRSYARVAVVDRASLLFYGRRALLQIDLATHRRAEEAHAVEIAEMFLALGCDLQPHVGRMPALDTLEPWRDLPAEELHWLDARTGSFNRVALARRFAQEVKARIERLWHKQPQEDGSHTPFLLPDRSVNSLIAAFEECL